MTYESRRLAGILLIVLPTVMFGGVSILSLLIGDPTYMQNSLRQDLCRAGHAHAGVWLILALVALRYVDEANLSYFMKWLVRGSIPVAAILVPAEFFLFCAVAHVGAVLLALGVLVLGSASSGGRHKGLIPTSADQNPLAQSRRPMDMIVQGRSMSLFQASQQWSTRSV